MLQIPDYESRGRTLMVAFTCERCRRTEYRTLQECTPKDSPIRDLADLAAPKDWHDGGFYNHTLCPDCYAKYKAFINGAELSGEVKPDGTA